MRAAAQFLWIARTFIFATKFRPQLMRHVAFGVILLMVYPEIRRAHIGRFHIPIKSESGVKYWHDRRDGPDPVAATTANHSRCEAIRKMQQLAPIIPNKW